MGAIRKSHCQTGRLNAAERRDARERRSNGDVEKAMDGFFNRKLVRLGEYLADVFPGLRWQYFRIAIPKQGHYEFFIAVDSK